MHGGELALHVLRSAGVAELFTLNGGHVWPFYDAAVKAGVPIYDTRHEQTATFAAEGMAKLTRRPGVAVLTAGPGVTNGISAMTTAHFNGSPLVVIGGRAPQRRWGSGSLQELDHLPIVSSLMKSAVTAMDVGDLGKLAGEAAATSMTPHTADGTGMALAVWMVLLLPASYTTGASTTTTGTSVKRIGSRRASGPALAG